MERRRQSKSTEQISAKFTVPIYEAIVHIVVSRDIHSYRNKYNNLFGDISDNDYSALCAYSNTGEFGLFFDSETITLTKIAHEVFHLTHRIMDWSGCNFDLDHHEQGALLHGWLMNKVNSMIKITK